MSRDAPGTMPAWSRPIRIPEEIEITHTDPPFAVAGETSCWRIPFKLSKGVPTGTGLRLQLWGARSNKGVFTGVQHENPGAEGYITAELEDGARVRLQAAEPKGTYSLVLPDGGLRKGDMLTVLLGDRGQSGAGVKVCRDHIFNKFFVLYAAPKDEAKARTPAWGGGGVWAPQTWDCMVAVCTMHIIGGPIHHIRAYVPAAVRPNKQFAVLVRPEDEFGNLSHQQLGPLTVSVNGTPLQVETETVSRSTCVRAGTALPSEGVYRLAVRDANSGKEALTNPTICSTTAAPVQWGMIHGHTEMSDGTGKLDDYFHQLKDELLLDFGAPGDHDHLWETPDDFWQTTRDAVRRWHEPGVFVALLGYEWAKWRKNGDGDRNVYYPGDDEPLYRSDDGEYPSPPDLFGALAESKTKAIIIPHHTGHGGNFCDWKDHSPEYERLVEMFQTRGGYECSVEEGNPVPERGSGHPPYPGGFVRRALALGWRVGFTAGGDDHSGHWGTEFRFDSGYKQGLMSVEAPAKTRDAVFEAMYNRRSVATTGARMLLSYRLNGQPMGSELSLRTMPGLASVRRLAVQFHGTAGVDSIVIIRNNSVVHSAAASGDMDLGLAWEDTDPIGDTWLPAAKFCGHPFLFYYVRVVQQDGEVAWASPVWIDP